MFRPKGLLQIAQARTGIPACSRAMHWEPSWISKCSAGATAPCRAPSSSASCSRDPRGMIEPDAACAGRCERATDPKELVELLPRPMARDGGPPRSAAIAAIESDLLLPPWHPARQPQRSPAADGQSDRRRASHQLPHVARSLLGVPAEPTKGRSSTPSTGYTSPPRRPPPHDVERLLSGTREHLKSHLGGTKRKR